MTERYRFGVLSNFALGEHFVMPRRLPDGEVVHGVWVLRKRGDRTNSMAELLAEFRSKLFATRWARERNETIKRPT